MEGWSQAQETASWRKCDWCILQDHQKVVRQGGSVGMQVFQTEGPAREKVQKARQGCMVNSLVVQQQEWSTGVDGEKSFRR